MDELEQRLRSALTDMAEEVTPSQNAWAEHQRRLALKSRRDRRKPALIAAAVAAAVAVIAVPTLLVSGVRFGGIDTASSPSSPPEATVSPRTTPPGTEGNPFEPAPGEQLLAGPVQITSTQEDNGRRWHGYAYVTQHNVTGRLLCLSNVAPGDPVNSRGQFGGRPTPYCVPAGASGARRLWQKIDFSFTSFTGAGIFVYLTSGDVKKALLMTESGYQTAYEVLAGPDFTVLIANTRTRKEPSAVTLMDANGNALEHD